VALLATFNRNTNLGGLASLEDVTLVPVSSPVFSVPDRRLIGLDCAVERPRRRIHKNKKIK
jgi:hypothetical protein